VSQCTNRLLAFAFIERKDQTAGGRLNAPQPLA
jgi:hypothetical protein